MKKLRAILFDLDDTLYPESEFVFSGFRSVARWAQETLGISEELSNSHLRKLFIDGVRGNTFDRWLEDMGNGDARTVKDAIRVYREHLPEIRPYPDVSGILQRLHDHYLLGIVSDGQWAMQERKMKALGISHMFSAIIFSDKLGSDCWKPSPKPFEAALERLNVDPNAACYVGDNIHKDFKGARSVGLKTIWMRRDDGIYSGITPPSEEYRPEYEITSFSMLEQLLISL
ncbi:MAG TPA: HAD family hydrolase [Nitrosomonas sp.]|nr:HAD family hydrolase [Nitrosomonas sp.]